MPSTTLIDPETIRVASVERWALRADRLIADRLADARTHAWNALTQRVVDAADGRATVRAVRSTRGYQAGIARIVEIQAALAGPSRVSLDGLIRDARAWFYRESFALLEPTIDPELRPAKWGPTKAGESRARGLALFGTDPWDALDGSVTAAARGFSVACVSAGARNETDAASRARLEEWEGRSRRALQSQVRALLSDSEVACFNLAGREMVDPKFYAEEG